MCLFEPTFLSTIDENTKNEIKEALSKSVKANQNKLTTTISESIATKYKITPEQVKEYFDFHPRTTLRTRTFPNTRSPPS